MKRQALYACLTCTPAAPEADSAGVCLACSLSCHDGHELVELYTKRYYTGGFCFVWSKSMCIKCTSQRKSCNKSVRKLSTSCVPTACS